MFTCICFPAAAIGNSKKAAKKSAAEKMVARLQSLSGGSEITWVRPLFLHIVKWLQEEAARSCVYCVFQSPKPSVLIENLRNSLGERMSLLRGNPLSALHTDYIQMMLELSKEQGFEVTYFNIGETMFLLVSMQQVQCRVSEQQSVTVRTAFTAPPAGGIAHYS